MLNFLKEMLEYYCWENYSVLEFTLIISAEIIGLGLLLGELIVSFKRWWNSMPQFEDYEDFEPKIEKNEENFILDISDYEDFDIFTPLSQQEKP